MLNRADSVNKSDIRRKYSANKQNNPRIIAIFVRILVVYSFIKEIETCICTKEKTGGSSPSIATR